MNKTLEKIQIALDKNLVQEKKLKARLQATQSRINIKKRKKDARVKILLGAALIGLIKSKQIKHDEVVNYIEKNFKDRDQAVLNNFIMSVEDEN